MQHRSPLAVALLTLFTFGIYGIYWLYQTRQELLDRHSDKEAIWPLIVLFLPVLFIITLMIVGTTFHSTQLNVLLFLGGGVGVIACIVVPFMWFSRYAKVVDAVSGRATNLYLFYVLLALVGASFVWFAVAQSTFNQIDKRPT